MKLISNLKSGNLVSSLNYVGMPVAALYAFSMLIWPIFISFGDWNYVQNVWDRWQGLNVGVLALASSVTAFNISRYNAERQREREFLASKAFLPEALSELVSYFKNSARVFLFAWNSNPRAKIEIEIPELPHHYKTVFSDCIRHAEPSVGDYLSKLLVWLQVHDARMRGFSANSSDEVDVSPNKINLIVYFYRLGELQALTNKLFSFARNMSEFDTTPLNYEDFRNAYGNLGIRIEEININEIHNLKSFTERTIQRDSAADSEVEK